MTKRIKRALSNGDPVNDWKRVILAALTLATLIVSAWNNSKISGVQTEARTAAHAATQAVENVEAMREVRAALPVTPTPTPSNEKRNKTAR